MPCMLWTSPPASCLAALDLNCVIKLMDTWWMQKPLLSCPYCSQISTLTSTWKCKTSSISCAPWVTALSIEDTGVVPFSFHRLCSYSTRAHLILLHCSFCSFPVRVSVCTGTQRMWLCSRRSCTDQASTSCCD